MSVPSFKSPSRGTVIYRGDRQSDESYDSFTVGKVYMYSDECDISQDAYWDGHIAVKNDDGIVTYTPDVDFDFVEPQDPKFEAKK